MSAILKYLCLIIVLVPVYLSALFSNFKQKASQTKNIKVSPTRLVCLRTRDLEEVCSVCCVVSVIESFKCKIVSRIQTVEGHSLLLLIILIVTLIVSGFFPVLRPTEPNLRASSDGYFFFSSTLSGRSLRLASVITIMDTLFFRVRWRSSQSSLASSAFSCEAAS